MKNIKDLISVDTHGAGELSVFEEKPRVTEETIKYLFAMFYTAYGAQWTRLYPVELQPAAMKQWLKTLENCPPDMVRHGLLNWSGDFPPNAISFRNACMSEQEVENDHGLNYRPQYLGRGTYIEEKKKKSDPEKVKSCIAEMREALSG